MPAWRSAAAAWWLAGASVLAGVATWLAWPPQTVEALMGEAGPVERVTAASYALCAAAVWVARRPGDDQRSILALAVVMAGFCMRELDWHKAFTGTTVLRLSWYWGPAEPGAKALAGLVVLTVALALGWLLWRHGRAVVRGAWQRRDPVAVTVLVFVVVLVVSKSLDRSVGILKDELGVVVPMRWTALRSALEEWMELALALLVLLGLVQHRAARPR